MSGMVQVSKNENPEPLYSELLNSDNPAFQRLVDKFIASIPGYLSEIELAMQKLDKTELNNIFHKIKGVSGNYGYPQLSEECKKAERLCQQDPAMLDVCVKNIIRISERIILAKKSE